MKWSLVTGGAKRLGKEIAAHLAKRKNNIVIHYRRSEKEAQDLAKHLMSLYGIHAETIQGDFTNREMTEDFINRYLNRFEETQNLINNVGNYLIRSCQETCNTEWEDLFNINFLAPLFICNGLLPSLKKNKGSIINLGVSGLQTFKAESKTSAYTLSKIALLAYTKSLAKDLAKDQVRVNMVSPGYLENAVDLPPDIKRIPMQRAAKMEEVCDVIDFLLSEQSRYITGQNIEVAGGLNL